MEMRYKALAYQSTCYGIQKKSVEEARESINQSIDRLDSGLRASLAFLGPEVRLVVFPEYFLTGFPMGESIEAWQKKGCLEMEGPEYERLGALAQKYRIFLAGNTYELDPLFPNLYFQTCFILDPSGNLILRYRRLNSMYAPTPHDVWDAYLDAYGVEGIFPVAQTEIGRLASVASEEILYPEITRCLAMRGAEVLVHPTSEIYSQKLTPKAIARRARALENQLWIVSANSGGIVDTSIPQGSTDGGSQVLDYRGLVLAESGPGESMTACEEIDLHASRAHRTRLGMGNLLSRQRFEAYNLVYTQSQAYPPNSFLKTTPHRALFKQQQQQAIQNLLKKGILS